MRRNPRQLGETETEFVDRTLWDAAYKLARESLKFPGRVYVYFRPSTTDDWGSLVLVGDDEEVPPGYEPVSPQPLPMWRTVESGGRWIYDRMRRLPILPQSPAAITKGMK